MQRSALCRARRELPNAYLLAKFRFDTPENEPIKVWFCDTQGSRLALRARLPAGGPREVQRSALCRARRELSNAYLLAKFRFDTAPRTSPLKSAQPSSAAGPRLSAGPPPEVMLRRNSVLELEHVTNTLKQVSQSSRKRATYSPKFFTTL